MADVREQTRNERIVSLTSTGWLSMNTLSRILDCPDASIRRSIQELRAEGYYLVLDQGQVRCHGRRTAIICQDPSENIGGDNDADYQQ